MAKISFSQAIANLQEKYKEARASKYVSKPISWALYQTWRKVDIIEERRPIPRVGETEACRSFEKERET